MSEDEGDIRLLRFAGDKNAYFTAIFSVMFSTRRLLIFAPTVSPQKTLCALRSEGDKFSVRMTADRKSVVIQYAQFNAASAKEQKVLTWQPGANCPHEDR